MMNLEKRSGQRGGSRSSLRFAAAPRYRYLSQKKQTNLEAK